MLPRWLTVGIAVLVTCAWAVNEVLVLAYPGHGGDSSLGPLFMVVVGATFAGGADMSAIRKRLGRMISGAPEAEAKQTDKPAGGDES